jgi:cysteine protease ATG4
VIIPQRLGLKFVDEAYFPQIKELLACKISMGILGGKSSSALYFIGYQNDTIVTLCPHYTQTSVDDLDEDALGTYRTNQSRNIDIRRYPHLSLLYLVIS